jgi:outer membrane protein assembly factor BamB
LEKTKKDFILSPSYQVAFEKRFGHYDLFNHYLRIDNELLYYLIGNPKEQHQNKILYSINPTTFETKEVWQLEKQPNHYNDLNGIKINDDLILSGNVYYSNRNSYDTQELFCIDLATKKEKWLRTVSSQVCSFGILDKGATLILALTNGQIELIESESGKTIEVINRGNNHSFARPLSLATFDNKIAVGLTNGQIEIYAR